MREKNFNGDYLPFKLFNSFRVDTGFKVSAAREPAPEPTTTTTTAEPGGEQGEDQASEEPQPAQVLKQAQSKNIESRFFKSDTFEGFFLGIS